MGADGGVRLTKIKSLKENWVNFRNTLESIIKNDLKDKNTDSWEDRYSQEDLEKVKKFPNSVDNKQDNEIMEYLNIFRNCDCPYLHENIIYTGEGNAIPKFMSDLSWALSLTVKDSFYIETWT